MNFKFTPIMLIMVLLSLFFNNACLSDNQKGNLIKMENGETITIGLNKTAIFNNIWKDGSLKDWNIKINILSIEKEGTEVKIDSSTFLGKDFSEIKFIKVGEFITIIQSEEVFTKIGVSKVFGDKAIFYLRIQSAPPAPELLDSFDVEIKD